MIKNFLAAALFFFVAIHLFAQSYQMVVDSKGHHGKVHQLLFTPDNDLISVSEDKSILVWDMENQTIKDKFFAPLTAGPEGMIYAGAIDNKGQVFCYGGYIQKDSAFVLVFLNIKTKKETVLPTQHKAPISSMTYSPDNRFIATGDLQGNVIIWEVSKNSLTQVRRYQLEDPINDFAYSPDGTRLAIASEGKYLHLYNLQENKLERLIEKHFYGISNVLYTSDDYLVTGGRDGFIHLFNSKGKHVKRIDALPNAVSSLSLSKDDKVLVAMTEGTGKGKAYSLPEGQLISTFEEHDNTVTASAISPVSVNGNYLAVSAGGSGNQLLVWNPLSGRLNSFLNGEGMSIWNLGFADSTRLLIGNSLNASRYSYAFDFNNQNLSTIDQTISESTSFGQKLNPHKLKLPNGVVIKNDPLVDGRILSTLELPQDEVIIGSDFSLKRYSMDGSLIKEYLEHTGGVRSLALSPNKRSFFSCGEDQVINCWSLSGEGSPLFQFFISRNGEWIQWDQHGYYSASPKGAQYLGWKTTEGFDAETSFFSVDQYFEVLFRPQAFMSSYETSRPVEDILNKRGEQKFDLSKLSKPSMAFFKKPYVDLPDGKSQYLSRRQYSQRYTTDVSPVHFDCTLYDRGGGIKEFKVYHNGKLAIIEKNISQNEEQRINKAFQLPLMSGVNEIDLVVTNYQNIDSKPHGMQIEYTGEVSAVSDLYVFTIGINEYTNPQYNLNYAYADAKAFTEKIVENTSEIFDDVHLYQLYNTDATYDQVEAVITEIQEKSTLQDVFIFYYAGHGTIDETNNNNYYLVPTDVTQLYGDSRQLQEKGISAGQIKEWLATIRAQKQLILLDACHSGEAVRTFASRGMSSQERAIVQLARSSGTVLISASGSKQFAVEFQELQHGAFTYALLEALDGKGEGGSGDRKITVNEIKAYMEDRVPELTIQYGNGVPQYPTGYSTGQDFPIKVND